jgi:hypothetical protein
MAPTSLFAALEVANGDAQRRRYRQHRRHEFFAFLNSVARRYPRRELHLICHYYGTHKHSAVRQWLSEDLLHTSPRPARRG